MSEKNIGHVAVYPSTEAIYWEFVIPSEEGTCEAQAREMTSHCERLFEAFADFVIPTELSYHVHCFPVGRSLPASVNDEDRVDTLERQLVDEEGIAVDAFLNAADTARSCSRWIPLVEFDQVRVKVRLEQGDVYANREHHCVEYATGKPLRRTPTADPLKVSLAHHPNRSHSAIDADFVTSVTVAPKSDLWFEDTEIARENARYLAKFLGRIDQIMPVETLNRVSDWVPVEKLEAVY